MNEYWKPTFHDLYEVSNLGNVRRIAPGINTKTGRVLKPCKSGNGYMIVGLHKGGSRKNCLVHRLVAEAFISQIPKGLTVNHKDGNKLNNELNNLEIVTYSENLKHAIRTGLATAPTERAIGENHWTHKHPDLVAKGERNGAYTKPECTLRGSQCPSSKLTEEDVRLIRKLHEQDKWDSKRIANLFNVTYQNINIIIARKTWKHVI